MYKSFVKTTLTICLLSIFSINYVIAMEEEDKNPQVTIRKMESPNAQSASPEEKKSCSHWGLTRWLYGVKEYVIDRNPLCGNDFKGLDFERTYIIKQRSSDCCCCACVDYCVGNPCFTCASYLCYFCICNDTCAHTLCCPFATITHMICLPFQCFLCTPPDWHNQARRHAEDYRRQENAEAEKRAEDNRRRKEAELEEYRRKKIEEEERLRNMTPEEKAEQNRLEAIRKQEAQANIDKINNQTTHIINTTNYGVYNYWNNIYPNNIR